MSLKKEFRDCRDIVRRTVKEHGRGKAYCLIAAAPFRLAWIITGWGFIKLGEKMSGDWR